MAIQVTIKRKVKQGRQAEELVPLILQMRALAKCQPGYMSSETWCDLEHPGNCMVISRWETVEDWNRWRYSKERTMIDRKIEALNEEPTQYHIYTPMVVMDEHKESNRKQTECLTYAS
jgi:antibiotic biosynthesis monooxygenase (ABM) superfamily enzyme